MAKFFLVNPGFELGDRDWTTAGFTIENDAVNSRSGAWVAKFTGGATAAMENLPNVPVRPGAKITISAYIDSSAATAGNGRVRLRWRDKDQVSMSLAFGSAIAFGGGGYVQSILQDSVAPDRTKFVGLEFEITDTPAGT